LPAYGVLAVFIFKLIVFYLIAISFIIIWRYFIFILLIICGLSIYI
jgi:hypothetical protein